MQTLQIVSSVSWPELLGLAEDARVQVQVVLGLRLVDVAGAAAREAGDVDQLDAELLGDRARRGVELLLREAGQAAGVVGVAALHVASFSSAAVAGRRRGARLSCVLSPAPRAACAACAPRRSSSPCAASAGSAPCRPAPASARTGSSLIAASGADRLGHQVRLEQVAGLVASTRRTPCACRAPSSRVHALLEDLGAQLGDRVARVDALRAALAAEVAARAVPDAVRAVDSSSRSLPPRSRTSPTKRAALASAAGPRKSGSASIELHSETQQPHRMQSASFMIWSSSSCWTRHSLTGGSASGVVQVRLDRPDLVPERLHVDDQVLDHRQVAHRRDRPARGPASTSGFIGVLQASTAPPSMRMPHEPQTAMRQRLAVGERAVALVLDDVEHVEQRRRLGGVDGVRLERRRSPVVGVVALDLEGDFAWSCSTGSVAADGGLVLGDGDRLVVEPHLAVVVPGERVPQPVLVVALGVVEPACGRRGSRCGRARR